MKVHFFERRIIPNRISIEKVFSVIKKELIKNNYTIKSFENPYPLSQMLKAMRYFKKNQGDINHITGDIHWACFLLNKNTTVLTIHDNIGVKSYESVLKRKLYLLIWLYLPLWKLKYITVISEKTKKELLEYYPSAISKIKVIPNPLTMEVYHREITMKISSEYIILIVGTRDNKNIDRIIEATKNIVCKIIIIGELNDQQNEKIKESKASVNVKFFISDIELENLYRSCDILCFPSLYEGFGMPIIEAQASGCAVITSNIEPMKSVADHAALFVDPYSTDDIYEKIILLMNNNLLRSDLVKKGYKNAEKYLPQEITKQYVNLYKEILNG